VDLRSGLPIPPSGHHKGINSKCYGQYNHPWLTGSDCPDHIKDIGSLGSVRPIASSGHRKRLKLKITLQIARS